MTKEPRTFKPGTILRRKTCACRVQVQKANELNRGWSDGIIVHLCPSCRWSEALRPRFRRMGVNVTIMSNNWTPDEMHDALGRIET